MEMRETQEEKDDAKSLKQKARERIRPKMGKLTIDYQKLHDAFFKFQTKPKMSSHGELYYEVSNFIIWFCFGRTTVPVCLFTLHL